eukprot:gene10709-12411_t
MEAEEKASAAIIATLLKPPAAATASPRLKSLKPPQQLAKSADGLGSPATQPDDAGPS